MVGFVVVVVATTKSDSTRAPEVPLTTPETIIDRTGRLLSIVLMIVQNSGSFGAREDQFTVE